MAGVHSNAFRTATLSGIICLRAEALLIFPGARLPQKDKSIEVKADIPGVSKDDIKCAPCIQHPAMQLGGLPGANGPCPSRCTLHAATPCALRRVNVDGDVLTIDVQKAEGEEAEEDQDGVKCALACSAR